MKKIIRIILIVIASIVVLCAILGIIDHSRATSGKEPIFVFRNVNIYSEGQLVATEYYGLGYKIVVCDRNCVDNRVVFMPLYLGAYAWFIGTDYITDVEIIKASDCNSKAQLYYSEENRNIYTYCLDQIKVNNDNNSMQLKDYLKTHSGTIDFIIKNFTKEPEASYDDGGTKLYNGNNFNILKCHTLNGNNDIYIGDKNMGYHNSFCR